MSYDSPSFLAKKSVLSKKLLDVSLVGDDVDGSIWSSGSLDIKITNILCFEKKCRFLVKSLYFGPNPIVNELISRF